MNSAISQLHPAASATAFHFGQGLFKKNETFTWDPDDEAEANPHLLVWGGSGAGKSFLLKEIISYLHSRQKHIHLIDLHGDLKTPNDNTMIIGGNQGKYGVNVFQFDSSNENAGPNGQISQIVSMFRSTYLQNMGGIQELVLKQLCSDTYLVSGLDRNNPSTWMDGTAEEKTPNLSSMLSLIDKILIQVKGPESIQIHIDAKIRSLRSLVSKHGEGHDLCSKEHAKLMETISAYVTSQYTDEENPLGQVKLDKAIDLGVYSNKKAIATLESLSMYAKALNECNIFQSTPPPVKKDVVNRYQLQYMDDDVRRFFVETLISKIFRAAQMRGEYHKRGQFNRGKKVDTYVILDEIQSIFPSSAAERNLQSQTYNRIAGEARKYGLGLIVLTQSPSSFPTPMLANITKRVGLKTNPIDIPDAKKRLGVSDNALFNHLQRPYSGIVSNKQGGYDPVDMERPAR